jgi:hypothetical protein
VTSADRRTGSRLADRQIDHHHAHHPLRSVAR